MFRQTTPHCLVRIRLMMVRPAENDLGADWAPQIHSKHIPAAPRCSKPMASAQPSTYNTSPRIPCNLSYLVIPYKHDLRRLSPDDQAVCMIVHLPRASIPCNSSSGDHLQLCHSPALPPAATRASPSGRRAVTCRAAVGGGREARVPAVPAVPARSAPDTREHVVVRGGTAAAAAAAAAARGCRGRDVTPVAASATRTGETVRGADSVLMALLRDFQTSPVDWDHVIYRQGPRIV